MAKNTGRLAGLAALGAAAYMMSRGKEAGTTDSNPTRGAGYKSTETREEPRRKIEDYQAKAPAEPREAGIAAANDVRSSSSTDSGQSTKPAPAPKVEAKVDQEVKAADEDKPLYKQSNVTIGGVKKRTEGNQPMPSLKQVESKAAARQASISTDAMKNASRASARRANLSAIDRIPGQSRSGPIGGERVSGTELSRNLSNTAAALTPIGGGLGKVGAELATSGRAQRAYNAAQAERRAAEGMSPAEALAARQEAVQAAREAKTLNPNAWLAGPKGMAENFRKGGAVKKMASGGMTASRRADGIATRGKTKCKMY